jgi:hypothetical protein
MKPEFSVQVFGKQSVIKFHKKPSSERFQYRLTDIRTDGRTDMTNVTHAFRSFANAPEWLCNNTTRGVRDVDNIYSYLELY